MLILSLWMTRISARLTEIVDKPDLDWSELYVWSVAMEECLTKALLEDMQGEFTRGYPWLTHERSQSVDHRVVLEKMANRDVMLKGGMSESDVKNWFTDMGPELFAGKPIIDALRDQIKRLKTLGFGCHR